MTEIVANGVRHHVQKLGSGPRIVVFVHGLVMDNLSSLYFTLANAVAERGATAVLYDLRGHGMSERPSSGYAVVELVRDLDDILKQLPYFANIASTSTISLVGNSFGGLISLAFSAIFPDRVNRLALIDAHDGTQGWAAQMAATLSLQGDARDAQIATSFASWLGRHSERKRNRLASAARALVETTSLIADLQTSPPLTDAQLARITCPTLALYGEHSDVRARGEHLARTLPDCTLRIVPGCTHSVLWEATAAVRDQIVEFLA